MILSISFIIALIFLVAYLFLCSKGKRKIAKSEAYYKVLFENQAQAVIVIEEDTTISLANKKAEQLSGYLKEVLNKIKLVDFCLILKRKNLSLPQSKER